MVYRGGGKPRTGQSRHNRLYRQFNGTSAATPYTVESVALLMEKNPEITLGEIKTGTP